MEGFRRYCGQCGSDVKQDTRFCANCGHAVADSLPPDSAGEHDVATRNLPVHAGAHGWDRSAVPPDGALFTGAGGFAVPGAPLPAGSAAGPRASTRPPASGAPFPPAPAPGPPGGRENARGRPGPGVAAGWPGFPPGHPDGPPRSSGSPHPADGSAGSGTETAQFSQTWMNDVGFSPQWEPGPPAAGGTLPGEERPRPRKLLAAGLFTLMAAVIVVPALLIAHSLHTITGGGTAAPRPTAAQPGPGPAAPTQRSAAAGLATLLAQTAADRSSIVSAVGSVEHCTAALGQAPRVFQTSAASRQRLLRQLAVLPGRSALPAPMLQALTGAWQASATVDTDLAAWAQDEAAQGCMPGDHANASYQASTAPDGQATADKTAFAGIWDTIAAKYGLPRYQTSQL